jgi:hypothetical protein
MPTSDMRLLEGCMNINNVGKELIKDPGLIINIIKNGCNMKRSLSEI